MKRVKSLLFIQSISNQPASPQAGLNRSVRIGITVRITVRSNGHAPKACSTRAAKIPVRTLPPVLAGIRTDKPRRSTFPCKAQWCRRTVCHRRDDDACLPLRGQHTLACNQASRFPFNCLRRTRRRAPKRRYCKACRVKATTKAADSAGFAGLLTNQQSTTISSP
jgi:hypothetical protein